MYKEDGFGTNQAYMTVGEPESLFLKDPPCLRGIDTRVRDNKLHFVVYFRSWDLWNGFPANLGAIQLLKEYMASSIGVEDGEIIAASKGLHLYDYVWELAKLRPCAPIPRRSPKANARSRFTAKTRRRRGKQKLSLRSLPALWNAFEVTIPLGRLCGEGFMKADLKGMSLAETEAWSRPKAFRLIEPSRCANGCSKGSSPPSGR